MREARLLITRRLPLYLSHLKGETATYLSRERARARLSEEQGGGSRLSEYTFNKLDSLGRT
jgi:hypothetical protein